MLCNIINSYVILVTLDQKFNANKRKQLLDICAECTTCKVKKCKNNRVEDSMNDLIIMNEYLINIEFINFIFDN